MRGWAVAASIGRGATSTMATVAEGDGGALRLMRNERLRGRP
jgi:hypothetical protein